MSPIQYNLSKIGAYLHSRPSLPERFPLFELLGIIYWCSIQLERMTRADKKVMMGSKKD